MQWIVRGLGAVTAESEPTYEQIVSAIGARFWQLAGPSFAEFAHRDLVFGATWQDCMWAVEQGVRDAYGLPDHSDEVL